MKKLGLGVLMLGALSGLFYAFSDYARASEESVDNGAISTINYYYEAETDIPEMETKNFTAPNQLVVNHYLDPAIGEYTLFMQEVYFNTDIGFRFYPEDHYYPFERFTEVGESYNDLISDDSFWIGDDYQGVRTINYYYEAETNIPEVDGYDFIAPSQLTVNHYLDPFIYEYTLFMQETYFNTTLGFEFYPEDHYYPFDRFTETDRSRNDLSTNTSFWVEW